MQLSYPAGITKAASSNHVQSHEGLHIVLISRGHQARGSRLLHSNQMLQQKNKPNKKKNSVSHRHLTWWNEIRRNLFLNEGKLQACWWLRSHTDSSLGSAPPVARQHWGSRAWTDMNREWPQTPPLQAPSAGSTVLKVRPVWGHTSKQYVYCQGYKAEIEADCWSREIGIFLFLNAIAQD